jgi:hypothetical protein
MQNLLPQISPLFAAEVGRNQLVSEKPELHQFQHQFADQIIKLLRL